MEKMSTEIATLFQKIQDVSKEYADIKDIFLDDSNMELVEDSVSVTPLYNFWIKPFLRNIDIPRL